MPFKRAIAPIEIPQGEALTKALVGIGMNFASEVSNHPNIEDTILAASIEGMERDDLCVLAVLVTWLTRYHPWINADRLTRTLTIVNAPRVLAFWTAVATWLQKDRRFFRIGRMYTGPCVDLLSTGMDFHLKRRGEDHRFKNTCLRVPAGILRDRPADVLPPDVLAKRHPTFRHRVRMGPSYRSDMWAALEEDPTLSPSELARRTYGSFATAWQVKHDFDVLAA